MGLALLLLLDVSSGAEFNVKDFGAKGDARIVHDAAMEGGSAKLVSTNAHFTAADVSQSVFVAGAGAKGGPLSSTIKAVGNPQSVELADVASNTVSGVSLTIGTDDTTAIKRAIEAAAVHGGTVYFPAGIYRTMRQVEVAASNIRLRGDGDASVIYNSHMNFYGYSKEKHLEGGWTGDRVVFIGTTNQPISNIEIDHLQVRNNGDTWVHASIGQPIVMTGATTNYVTRNFRMHHVTLTTTSYNGYSNGGILDGFEIHHVVVKEVAKEAIYLAGFPSNGVVADNQLSTTINTAISNIGIACKNMKHVKILRNNIRGKFWVGIGLFTFPEEDVLIADNVCSFTPHPHAANGICADRGTHITVSNNTVENAGGFGITFRGPETNVCDVVIKDNAIRNTERGFGISVMGGNDPSRGPRNVTITGNTLVNNAHGIEAWNLTGNNKITGNKLTAGNRPKETAFHVSAVEGATITCADNDVEGELEASGFLRQHYRKQAVAAVNDLLKNFWTGDAATGQIVNTWHGYPKYERGDARGGLWERGTMYFALENLWRITGDPALRQRLRADWQRTKKVFPPEKLEACGQDSSTNWAVDDAGWSALMYLAAYRATEDPDALARARGLVNAAFTRWMDDALGGGMWYRDKRDIKSLYQTAIVLAALRIHEITGDNSFRERAVKCYTWMEEHLLRDDGLYWADLEAAGPKGKERPNDIHEAGSVVFLGGNMAMGVIHARLFRATGDDRYRQRALRTAAALLKRLTTAEGVFFNDRDAWANGTFADDWAREVLSLPGIGREHWTVLRKTADSIFTKARTADGYYGGSWSGPAEGEGSAWFRKKSMPQQIMTSANSVNMIVAAACKP